MIRFVLPFLFQTLLHTLIHFVSNKKGVAYIVIAAVTVDVNGAVGYYLKGFCCRWFVLQWKQRKNITTTSDKAQVAKKKGNAGKLGTSTKQKRANNYTRDAEDVVPPGQVIERHQQHAMIAAEFRHLLHVLR